MKSIRIMIAAIAIVGAASAQHVKRAAVQAMERSFDARMQQVVTEPFDLLGNTRGVYLEGYGAVFTAEVNLIVSPAISPFRPPFTKEEIEKIHQRKLQKLPVLRENMREMLLASSASLDGVAAGEQIVLGVTLFNYKYEDASRLPNQIVMQAEKGKLLEVQSGRASKSTLDSVIKVQEL
jgi:hypothetical protein